MANPYESRNEQFAQRSAEIDGLKKQIAEDFKNDPARKATLEQAFKSYGGAILDLAIEHKGPLDKQALMELGSKAHQMEQARKQVRQESVDEMQRLTAEKQGDVRLDKALSDIGRERQGKIVKPEKTIDVPQAVGPMEITSASGAELYTPDQLAEMQKKADRFRALRDTVAVPKDAGKMEVTSGSAIEFSAQDLAKSQAEANAKRLRMEQALKEVGGIETRKIDVGEVSPELIAAHPIVENNRADDMQRVAAKSAEFQQAQGGRGLELAPELAGDTGIELEDFPTEVLNAEKARFDRQQAELKRTQAENAMLKKYFSSLLNESGEFPPNFKREVALKRIQEAQDRMKKAA